MTVLAGPLATRRSALAFVAVQLLLVAASFPLGALAHQLNASTITAGTAAELAFTCVGGLIAYRRPNRAMGWIILAVSALLTLSADGSGYAVLDYRQHGGRLPVGWLALVVQPWWLPGFAALVLAIVLFPDGRPPGNRWWWPLRGFIALLAIWVIAAAALTIHVLLAGRVRVESGGDLYQFDHPPGAWSIGRDLTLLLLVALALLFGSWLVSQLRGYRKLSGERRIQQKWILTGAVVAALAELTNLLPYPFSSTGNQVTIADFTTIGLAALPFAMGVGILKYRLYEIDRLVSRTLAYAIVTAVLGGTFVGMVVLLTDALPFSSTVGVAASTLAAAALFNPVRVRVQRTVDRRFNRARYDAEATVMEFAGRLRDAVDLDTVQSELLDVVRHAVQPAHATIWVRPAHHSTRLQTPG
jgi:hypothetical protein